LQNPLNKMFSFEYLVTGKWDDPKVERLSRVATPPPTPDSFKPANPPGASHEPARQ